MCEFAIKVFSGLFLTIGATYAFAQTDELPKAEVGEPMKLEVFRGARIKSMPKMTFPGELRRLNKEGWVGLSMMVDPQGKPYEVMVTQSSGDKEFEKDAIKAVGRWQFEPAMIEGKAVDSAFETKIDYRLKGPGGGARPEFVKAFRAVYDAIERGDKAAAEAAFRKLSVDNLYEDAFLGFAQYAYAAKWGTEAGQLAGLTRAIAYEKDSKFLAKPQFQAALIALLPLQVRAKDFESALMTWESLRNLKPDQKVLDAFEPIVAQINTLRTDARAYSVAGQLRDGYWYYRLFKKNFSVSVSTGHLSEVKLRCEKAFVFFPFDPALTYNIADTSGKCLLQLLGDPGTKIKLTQS